MTTPSKQQDQFIVRLPDGMRDKIRAAAKASGRSMNAEIVQHLRRIYDADLRAAMVEEARATFGAQTAAQLAELLAGSAAGPQAGTDNPAADH